MIEWIIIAVIGGTIGGFLIGYFWDEIKSWAKRVLEYLLDGISKVIETVSDTVIYLVKQGYRYYKRLEVYIRNVSSGKMRRRYKEEEISEYDIPEELRSQFDNQQEIAIMQRAI